MTTDAFPPGDTDAAHPGASDFPFSVTVVDVHLQDAVVQVHVGCETEAIDYYAAHVPSETDLIPYYARLWESGEALAGHMSASPGRWSGLRVLELGCGLGLPSLVAARAGAQVVSTDFHPDTGAFFRANARLNGVTVPYLQMDWRAPCLTTPFDVVIGSDLLYETSMISPLVACIDQLCRRDGLLILTDPGRRGLQRAADELMACGFAIDIDVVSDVFLLEGRRGALDHRSGSCRLVRA